MFVGQLCPATASEAGIPLTPVPPIIFLPSLKVLAIWAASSIAAYGDLTYFTGFSVPSMDDAVGGLVLAFIAAVTIYATFRTNAVKFWRETAEARDQRIKEMELEMRQQRELKHEALSENAALRIKTDMTPVLAALAEQKLADQEALAGIRQSLEELSAASQEQTKTLAAIAARLNERMGT